VIGNKMGVSFPAKTFVINIYCKRKLARHYYKFIHIAVTVIFADLKRTWIFSTDFRKTFKYQFSKKSVH